MILVFIGKTRNVSTYFLEVCTEILLCYLIMHEDTKIPNNIHKNTMILVFTVSISKNAIKSENLPKKTIKSKGVP